MRNAYLCPPKSFYYGSVHDSFQRWDDWSDRVARRRTRVSDQQHHLQGINRVKAAGYAYGEDRAGPRQLRAQVKAATAVAKALEASTIAAARLIEKAAAREAAVADTSTESLPPYRHTYKKRSRVKGRQRLRSNSSSKPKVVAASATRDDVPLRPAEVRCARPGVLQSLAPASPMSFVCISVEGRSDWAGAAAAAAHVGQTALAAAVRVAYLFEDAGVRVYGGFRFLRSGTTPR